MQNSHLKLKEIIWEITGRCENNCSYCGSKENWNVKINEDDILLIAQKIVQYPPEEIDISGGDPLLVSYDTHKKVVRALKDKNVRCKILVNPKSIGHNNMIPFTILDLYDWVGISINEEDEINKMKEFNDRKWFKNDDCSVLLKSTIISNFNLQNVFLYDEIESIVKEHNLMWQIQYTMYKDPQEKMALYNSDKASNFLFGKIRQSISNKTNIILADNMTNSACGAGLCSLGILYNGDVVPCLSMRSWKDEKFAVANLITDVETDSTYFSNKLSEEQYDLWANNKLKYVWENLFQEQRFQSFKCCKDHCKNKCFVNNEIKKEKKVEKKNGWELEELNPNFSRVLLYGIFGKKSPPETPLSPTFVYGVPGGKKQNVVSVYAVQTPDYESTHFFTETTTSILPVQNFEITQTTNPDVPKKEEDKK